jgi:hypothetical protein
MMPRPLPAAPLVVRRRYLAVVPRPLARCASQVLNRGALVDTRGAAHVLGRGAQVDARGAARCASQITCRGAQTDARGAAQVLDRCAARCASQLLDRDAQAVARGAATLPQQETNNSVDAQRCRVNITGFVFTVLK